MHTTTGSRPAALVDVEHLFCSGCHDHVRPDPPTCTPIGPVVQFSHRGGSPLCPDLAGRVVEPVEATR